MQRYFVAPSAMTNHTVSITGEDVKHITRVMRMQEGDQLICCDNESRTVLCTITSFEENLVNAQINETLHPNTELPISITIAQGLPKGDKFDLIVQKGTELGAQAFLPVAASRSVVKWDPKKMKKKLERLEKIAKEAAEQSYRERIPTVLEAHSFSGLINKVKSDTYKASIVAYEESAKSGERSQLVQSLQMLDLGDSLLVIIGPEGGFSEKEIEELVQAGAVLCGFGPRILRTETAGLYVLAAVSYHFELMR
ncbi:16S rRNA (uracil(1498)-N(3))-methyltransferase [Bacillus solitudinis]|uniref:16S rRNA (uracil(1498)-N(3))-methyltransferase n=1 Tax=Bacillus solitudinis TaxID=2014074 RepID=UPI000C23CF10|nr:16S rRNA (uracil(1498)-N(3))-methyltransferase [Bacillus solitudinis]